MSKNVTALLDKPKRHFVMQCPTLNRITFGQHKSDNNDGMIQLTKVFCELLRFHLASMQQYLISING